MYHGTFLINTFRQWDTIHALSSASGENWTPLWHYQDPSKIDKSTNHKLIREAAQRTNATLNKLQEYLASTGQQSFVFFRCLDYGIGWLDGSPNWKPNPSLPKFCQTMWQYLLWPDETKLDFFGHNSKCYVKCKNKPAYHPKNPIPTMKLGVGSIMLWGLTSVKIEKIHG